MLRGQGRNRSLASAVILLSLLTIPVYGQISKYRFTRFTETDGLPTARVHQAIADRFGYIWVGTINGLARYDGYSFKRFYSNPNDSASINGLVIWRIFEDRKGYIWISAGLENLNIYDPATGAFRHLAYKHLIDHPANVELGIDTYCQDQQGRLYFGVSTNFGEPVTGALLYKDEQDTVIRVFRSPDSLKLRNVLQLATDRHNQVWLISYSGLFRIDSTRKIFRVRTLDQPFNSSKEGPTDMKIDREGHLWITTDRANLYEYLPEEDRYERYTPNICTSQKAVHIDFSSTRLELDESQNLIVAMPKCVQYFDRKRKKFEWISDYQLPDGEIPVIFSLSIDAFGNIWMGTQGSGLFKLEKKAPLITYRFSQNNPSSITQGWVNRFAEDRNGRIWFTSSGVNRGMGLNELDLQTGMVKTYPYSSFNPRLFSVSGLKAMPSGEVLLSSNLGLLQFNPASRSLTEHQIDGYPGTSYINFFLTDQRQNQWMATVEGLYVKKPGEKNYILHDLSKVEGGNASSNIVTYLFESRRNGLWILTDNGLFLYKYDSGTFERHGFDKSRGDVFISQDINSIYEDSSGHVWLGTWQGGLSRYSISDRKIRTYTRDDGLPSMSIQGILADEKNSLLWLSTFEGLCRFEMKTGQCSNFSLDDGIQGPLFADGSCLKSTSGFFLFGGANGITLFHPEEVNLQSAPPKVYLTGIKLFNKSLVPGKNPILKSALFETKAITLDYNQNNITLEFIALHYTHPSKNRYAYILENYDTEWREVGNQREAFYPKLPPGKYIFRVKAANSIGTWNTTGATLEITVRPPWWLTPWAYAGYALVLLGLGLVVNRYLRQRLLAEEQEKNRQRELAHAREIEKAYHKLEESHETLKATQTQLIQAEKMASLGELTAGIAHEIQNPLNFVNNFAELNKELLREMKDELVLGNKDQAVTIADDIIENEEKISYHGKRADTIVKSMLQHSRSSVGIKEATDLNALADEYLRLAYHGLRAKDKSFEVNLITEFDPEIGKISLFPQDIGRMLLNLITNAFYAVSQKKKHSGPVYEPTVSVSTKKMANEVEIRIRDNGIGIPKHLLDKIFQPFFTTKPTGQGTGLGLSLSYDIAKIHGGEIKVETEIGRQTEFIVTLPAT